MKMLPITALTLCLAAPALAEMQVRLLPPWGGANVPAGQQCTLFGGNGATPPMRITNLPAGTAEIVVQYNDLSYRPLSKNGGHGTIGYRVSGSSASLPAVPGMTKNLPDGVRVVRRARSSGRYASPGYLPPCSGGKGNTYAATILAKSASGKTLEKITIPIGRY